MSAFENIIEKLPSAQPERMKDSLKNEVQNTVEAWIYRKTGDQNARLTDDDGEGE